MSLRTRLTIWYVGLLAALLVISGTGVYAVISLSSYNEVDRTLENRASDIEKSVDAALAVQRNPGQVFRQGGILLPGADVFADSDIYVQISRPDGSPVSKSDNLRSQTLSVTPEQLSQVNAGHSLYTILRVNQTRLRVYITPLTITNGTQPLGVIEVAQSLRTVDDTLRRLATLIIVSIVAALAIAALGGALLARQALKPIDRVSTTARTITRARDLGRRIDTASTSDEVGRLASTFNEMLTRIEDLFRAQQRFVADVSHELRTPLTAVRGNLDLLRRGAAADAVAREEALSAIDSETARMSRMVADLLLLAQTDAGVPMAREPVELDTLLLDVYRQAQVLADGVKVSLGAEDQAIVYGDRDRLKQVLLNLVDNAIKYTPAGGEVTLSLEKNDEWVRIAVRDTGIGIAPGNVPLLFERFYRVDKSRAREVSANVVPRPARRGQSAVGIATEVIEPDGIGASGSGLGLAIVKSVLDAHNGRITVESKPGEGSTFTVWLPRGDKRPPENSSNHSDADTPDDLSF